MRKLAPLWYSVGAVVLCLLAWKFLPDLLYLLVPGAGLSAAAKARKARASRDRQDIDAQIAKNEEVVHKLDPETVEVEVRTVRQEATEDGDYWTPLELD